MSSSPLQLQLRLCYSIDSACGNKRPDRPCQLPAVHSVPSQYPASSLLSPGVTSTSPSTHPLASIPRLSRLPDHGAQHRSGLCKTKQKKHAQARRCVFITCFLRLPHSCFERTGQPGARSIKPTDVVAIQVYQSHGSRTSRLGLGLENPLSLVFGLRQPSLDAGMNFREVGGLATYLPYHRARLHNTSNVHHVNIRP